MNIQNHIKNIEMRNVTNVIRWYFSGCKYPNSANRYMEYMIKRQGDEMVCDFSLIGRQNTKIPALIVNNNPLNIDMFSHCMPMCQNIVLSDGGANHFYRSDFRDSEKVRALVGDFDCIDNRILEYYEEKGKHLEYVSNWEQNDFDKALEFCVENNWKQLFCFGAFGGRMDQTLAAMHLATKYCNMHPDLEVVLLGKENIMFHLKKNLQYRIKINPDILNSYGCGLITFGRAQYVQTSGFRWNLGYAHPYQTLQWGKFLSICNEIVDDSFSVLSSQDLFFVTRYSQKIMMR